MPNEPSALQRRSPPAGVQEKDVSAARATCHACVAGLAIGEPLEVIPLTAPPSFSEHPMPGAAGI